MKLRTGYFVVVMLLVGIFAKGVVAQGLTGGEILQQVDNSMSSESKIMTEQMTLISASGQQRTRELQVWNKSSDNKDQMLVKFLAPADVRGTGMLMSEDDMWLYLPALGRVRRIAGHAKKGYFMGSDLTYEDMEQIGTKGFSSDFKSELVGDETIDGSSVYVLKLTPINPDSDYSNLEMWVDKDKFLPRKIQYYNTSGSLVKVLTTYDLKSVDDRWVATRMEMEDREKGSRTLIEIKEVTFDVEISDSTFSTRNLERGL